MKATLTPLIPRLVPSSQLERAAEVLARAFHDDPVVRFIFPNEKGRTPWLKMMFGVQVRLGHRYGRVYTTEDFAGVAVWLAPENVGLSPWQYLRAHGLTFGFNTPLGVLKRSLRFLGYAQKLHRQCITAKHWYLPYLGVEPAHQGKGTGSRLLKPVLEQADADGLPCFLETASERTIRLYERHGFVIIREGNTLRGGPRLWAMLRNPRRATDPLPRDAAL
jgi:ribosomal protein S18 acetylase RimI-like enzyme